MMYKQPKIKIESTDLEKFIERAAFIIAVFAIIITTYMLKDLPDTVATHFDLNGQVDGYGSKYLTITLIPVVVIMYIGLSFLQRIPHVYNYIVKITDKNAEIQYRLAIRFIRMLKFEIAAMFIFLYFDTVISAKEGKMVFGIWFVPIMVIFLFFTIGVYIAKSIKAK